MSSILLLAVLTLSPQEAKAKPQSWLLKDARIVVQPGKVLDKADLLIQDGRIAAIGTNIDAVGAEVIDCTGLIAYPGLIHPLVRVGSSTPTPAQAPNPPESTPTPAGEEEVTRPRRQQDTTTDPAEAMRRRDADPWGRNDNLLSKNRTADSKFENVSSLASLAKNGYAVAHISTSGGLFGATSAIYSLESGSLTTGTLLAKPEMIPISFSSRAGAGYPGSLMAIVAFIRQGLADAEWYQRRREKNQPVDPNPGIENLVPVITGKTSAIFEDLTENNFYIARRIANEFKIRPVFGIRSGSVAYADLLDGTTVLLRGTIPSKPTIGENLASVSLSSVRNYFNELQSAKLLQSKGVDFLYSPGATFEPLEGIREYVRAGLDRDAALASMTTRPAKFLGIDQVAGTLEKGKLGNVLLTQGDLFDSTSQVMAVFANGKRIEFAMPDRKKPEDLKADPPLALLPPKMTQFPAPAETTPAFRLYRNATIWTMGPQGTLKGADLLIKDGKIQAVGRGLKAPTGCEVIDATGKHLSPGIWDAHSHTAISGGVNEGSNMVTVECRIADVINHLDPGAYIQLSGGTVGALQLHGSANAIGGQSATVKWRWGMRPDDYRVAGAPEGVKFALGQNPIREDTGGFGGRPTPIGNHLMTWRPRTRMGVEESIRRALQLGKEYNEQWAAYRAGTTTLEPRRDLQLEGLGEIVASTRWVHSHGYRADEMLMLIRVIDQFGGKLATLQHVLEGYKMADEMAEAGVGGSTFADWWGYKLEAYDATPYNAALMAERGVSVSVNSDSGNHARRLNQEAAKSMRYGGVSAETALSFVTIEPCRQLGIADRTGSLEVGKDADLAVWTAEPLSIFAMCLETYVDGIKRFDRANDAEQRKQREAELMEAKRILQGEPPAKVESPAAVDETITPTTAKFGIGPLQTRSGATRYPRRAIVITGATVHPMKGDPFVGDVRIDENGKIEAVGRGLSTHGAQRIDARGKHLYPGLIDPVTTIGLNEIGQVPASDDSSERGNFHPDYQVERVINPEWETLGVARHQGVLTVLVRPAGSGAAGQAALIHTEGYTWEDLTVKSGAALAYLSGGGGFGGFEDDRCLCEVIEDVHEHEEEDERMAGLQQRGQAQTGAMSRQLSELSELLDKSRDYLFKQRSATPENPVPVNLAQEAMAKVAARQMPVLLSANSATDIRAAVEWAEKERIRIVLYGCSGAGEIADWLAAKQVPIILNAVYRVPSAEQPVDWFYSLPARLSKAGVKYCLTTDNDKDVRQIRDHAGWAAAYGVDREEAARLITIRAAEVLGIDNRLGAIVPGMDGTLILTDGEIIETKTQVLRAWIEGREVALTNKQTRLYEKYKDRPRTAKR